MRLFPTRPRYRHRAAIVERQGGVCPQCGEGLDLTISPRWKFEAVSLDGKEAGATWDAVEAVHTWCLHLRRIDEQIARREGAA